MEGQFDLPEGAFLAKVDVLFAVQDYFPYHPCVRLVGVSPKSFESVSFNDRDNGCETFIIDIGALDILRLDLRGGDSRWRWIKDAFAALYIEFQKLGKGELARSPWRFPRWRWGISDWDVPLDGKEWIRLDFEVAATATNSYAYCAFRDQEPTPVSIQSMMMVKGVPVDPPQAPSAGNELVVTVPGTTKTRLDAFHVGQGMCSLASNGPEGVLVDCGAGTPVLRDRYRSGPIRNELSAAIAAIDNLRAVISHRDSDHWKLLEWDSSLREKVRRVYLPAGVAELAFSSPALVHKVTGIGDASFVFPDQSKLEAYRSNPASKDSNGECLVVVAHVEDKAALLPGDYVYSRMKNDLRLDGKVSALVRQSFHAVVVPHHGDHESGKEVPPAADPGVSPAFFSAGNHSTWRHPRYESLMAHSKKQYRAINDRTQLNVLACKLLP